MGGECFRCKNRDAPIGIHVESRSALQTRSSEDYGPELMSVHEPTECKWRYGHIVHPRGLARCLAVLISSMLGAHVRQLWQCRMSMNRAFRKQPFLPAACLKCGKIKSPALLIGIKIKNQPARFAPEVHIIFDIRSVGNAPRGESGRHEPQIGG